MYDEGFRINPRILAHKGFRNRWKSFGNLEYRIFPIPMKKWAKVSNLGVGFWNVKNLAGEIRNYA